MDIALLATVNAPVLDKVASPDITTGAAFAEALPTNMLAEGKFVLNLLLNVIQSAEVKAPREVAEALGTFNVVELPNAVVGEE